MAKKENIFSTSGTNYTCAIDSFLSLCEALLLCGNKQTICHSLNFSPILQEVRRVLIWRLQNDYQWNHELRNHLWQLLANSFPAAICPIGKITAAVEPAVMDLEKLWFVEAIVETECSDCGKELGRFKIICEEIVLTSPKNGELKNKNYTLSELFLNRLSKHVNYVLRHKVRCPADKCLGIAGHTGVQQNNLKIPPFLFLNFLVLGNPSNYYNDLKDSCTLDENWKLANHSLKLLCGLMSSQLHFFSICNYFGTFYKLDNMIQEQTSKGFSSFKEAYYSKPSTPAETNLFHISRKSVRARKGALYFAVYQGEDRNDVIEEEWTKRCMNIETLNDLPNLLNRAVLDKTDVPQEVNVPDDLSNDSVRQNHLYKEYLAENHALDKIMEDCNNVLKHFAEIVKATTDPDKKDMQKGLVEKLKVAMDVISAAVKAGFEKEIAEKKTALLKDAKELLSVWLNRSEECKC